jgi:DNA-binding PadR family transcriptional regulator
MKSASALGEIATWLFFGDFVRLYVLFHAARNPVTALELTGELNHQGYHFNVGKLDGVLTSLEKKGYLAATASAVSNGLGKCYETTTKGRDFLVLAKGKLQGLAETILHLSEEGTS